MKGMKEILHLVEGFLAHPNHHCICARPERSRSYFILNYPPVISIKSGNK